MPSGGGSDTRANDIFADGDEYNVEDAALLLFTNTTDDENTAKLVTAYPLKLEWQEDVDNDQITKQGSQVRRITDDGNRYKYALVVLNYKKVFSIVENNVQFVTSSTSETAKNFTGTFQEFSQYVVEGTASSGTTTTADDATNKFKYTSDSKTYFLMTNAVVAAKAGNSADNASANTSSVLTMLADGNTSLIYKTQAEAEAEDAKVANIIVERAVAKVQMTSSATAGSELTDIEVQSTVSEGYTKLILASSKPVQWKLNNMNKKSYLVRNWAQTPATSNASVYGDSWFKLYSDGDGDGVTSVPDVLSSGKTGYNAYRFAGINKIANASDTNSGTNNTNIVDPSECYRTYFCVDPNYETKLGTGYLDGAESEYVEPGESSLKYCYENTFNVKNQTFQNTTYAMVKVQFVYAKKGDNNTVTSANATDNTFYILSNVTKSTVYTKDALIAEIKKATELSGKTEVTITLGVESTSGETSTVTELGDNNITYAGQVVIKEVKYKDSSSSNETTMSDDSLAAFNAKYTIERYYDGVAYYPVLIKHFGDDLTPWNSSTKTSYAYPEPTTTSAGTSANDRWLGRYGVVRNNWYLLNITGVESIGYSEPPTPDDTTDDEIDSWVNVRVTMLSWAKRQQDIKL